MLPSTGYFKGNNCPFYDSGLCERPYCHFRHVKKESQNTASDGIESGEILQKLVSAAVQRVLEQTETSGTTTPPNTEDTNTGISKTNTILPKATYNPTPISELIKINNIDTENNEENNEQRKRHIPVPYTPRKPASLPVKRPVDTNGSSKPFIFIPPPVKYTPGCSEPVQLDTYTPKGAVESNSKYQPGTELELPKYNPKETQSSQPSSKLNYIPSSDKTKTKLLEYKPVKVNPSKTNKVTYQPTPRSLAPCFSSDEEEPDTKKRKLSGELNGFDDLGPEFDILDQILDEEKSEEKLDKKVNDKIEPQLDKKLKFSKENSDHSNRKKRDRLSVQSDDRKKSHERNKCKNEKSISPDIKKDEKELKSLEKKSSHKKASRDKEKPKKHKSSERDRHTSSKKSKQPKDSNSSSKKSDSHSKSRSSKSTSKNNDKNEHRKSHKSSHKESKDKHKKKKKEPNNFSDNENGPNETFDSNAEELCISESDEETIALECKKIFEEYVPTDSVKQVIEVIGNEEDAHDNEYVPGKKRISRTINKDIKIIPKAPAKPDYKVNAARAMAERLAKVREYHASITLNSLSSDGENNKIEPPKHSMTTPNSGSTKIRIAHVPYASTLMNAKKIIPPKTQHNNEPSTSTTVVQTVKKGAPRVAHIPNEKFIDRPGVLEPLASKIPANIRSTYLNMMIDECLKIYLSATDAYARAQHEELTTSKKCSTVQIYKNSAVLAVSRLRKEFQECNGIKKSGSDCAALQKIPQAVSGKTSGTGSWSIENKNRKTGDNSQEHSGAKLYTNISKWILTEQQLQDNGFPRPHPSREKGRATIYAQNKQNPPKGYIRTCCRCKKDFTVDKKGFAAVKQECIYHPNNKYRVRGEARYQCCSQDATSDGCCIAPSHVYDYVDYENLKGYVTTLPPERETNDYGVYSLDCEMCYTTHGLDLTRVTVINSACKVVYETLIKPLHPIIDYNTRYSGITEEHMGQVKTTLLEVQATLLTMFNSKTILIGHSLESDFKALKLIHDTVIDTSVLFPHKMGPPYKRALRNLSSEFLKKIIQNSVEGHDSAEDATVCMELIHFKLKEDLKTR